MRSERGIPLVLSISRARKNKRPSKNLGREDALLVLVTGTDRGSVPIAVRASWQQWLSYAGLDGYSTPAQYADVTLARALARVRTCLRLKSWH